MTSPEQLSGGVPGLGQVTKHPGHDSSVSAFGKPFFGCRGREPLDPQQRLRRAEPLTDPAHETLATSGEQQRELDRRATRVEHQHQAARTASGGLAGAHGRPSLGACSRCWRYAMPAGLLSVGVLPFGLLPFGLLPFGLLSGLLSVGLACCSAEGPEPDRYQERQMSLCTGMRRGMSRSPGMNGTQSSRMVRRAGHVDGDHVDVGRVGPARHLVPQRVQPQPGLAGVAAGLVHDAPLAAGQAQRRGLVGEVGAVLDEQQRLGEVRAVERLLGQQVGVQCAAAGQGQLAGHQRRDRPVVGGRDDRAAVDELHFRHRVRVGVGPLQLLGGRRGPVGGERGGDGRVGGASVASGPRTKSCAALTGWVTPGMVCGENSSCWTLPFWLLYGGP